MILQNLKTNFLLIVLTLVLLPTLSSAQVSYQEAFPNIGFNAPVEIQNAGDGTNRLFVVEQPGVIKVFPNNSSVSQNQVATFLDISQKVSYSVGQEIGLLGLAFHPQFSDNRYIFVYYIDQPNSYRINIARYQVSSSNPNEVDPNSETLIAQFTKNQSESNHNGGKIGFGPDGFLYISIGDGGGGGDPQGNGQNLNTVFGSILRLDIDINGDNPIESNPDLPNGNYEIPSTNPRVGQNGLDEIYAWGIRNTWKFSFDATGRLWGADVGQNAFEEINIITNGGNFGWNRFEGNSDYRTNTALVTNPDTKPIFAYDHSAGDKSITGGYMYRGSLSSASLQNKYIYGDFTTGRVWALTYNSDNGATNSELLFRANGQAISSFGEDESGELYFSDYGNNAKLYKLAETVTGPVTIAVNGVGDWKGITSGTNGTVATIAQTLDNTRYVGGSFSRAGGITASNLAIVTAEEQWQAFGSGTNGPVTAIAISSNGYVYVGGDFTQIGGISANNIAFWDGSAWSALENGTNGPVLAIEFDSEENLFVGGVFSDAGLVTVNNIAIWKNSSWTALTDSSTGVSGTNNEVRSLAFDDNNNLYIGGNFDAAGNIPAARIAQWNGSNWSGLGEGTSGFVQAITVVDNFVYAGGNFNLAGNSTANRIARWNLLNNSWERLGFGLSGSVNTIASDGNYIYVAGNFETASDTEDNSKIVNNIARWSTTGGWEALGPNTQVGTNSSIQTLYLSINQNELSVGGNFSTAGGLAYNNIALWSEVFCSENSVSPEYQVNGVWSSGNNALTIDEGNRLVLSILPNTTDFTITLPNGQEVTGDYSLESVTTSLSGTYLFTTTQGCLAALEVTINASTTNDSDNDGVVDTEDSCPNTPVGETADTNGCSTAQLDTDGDGVSNEEDQCPNTPAGESVDSFGCNASQNDADGDGITNEDDLCPNTLAGESVDTNGCSTAQLDTDEDGVSNEDDECPDTPAGESVDSFGCDASQNDADGDGITNEDDLCPNTLAGESVDTNGCSTAQLDTDGDGITNEDDECPDTPAGESVDSFGCNASQNDADGDGITNEDDLCPNTLAGESVDTNGCSTAQLDTDGDGITNEDDECPDTALGEIVNSNGCASARFPDGQFSITTTPNSCVTNVNGQINLASTVPNEYLFRLWITEQNVSTNTFTSSLEIPNLDTGIYTLCITATSLPNLESCFTITIDATESLEVESTLSDSGTSISLSLRGAEKYFISLNEKQLETELEEITIDLDKNVNTLEVTSDITCQGSYEETIVMKDVFIVYPNPINDFVSIDVSKLTDEQIEISLFSITGKLFLNESHNTEEGIITITTSNLDSGYFILRISGKSIEKAFKLIK
jgi:glucose/arabinose dehydrogenase